MITGTRLPDAHVVGFAELALLTLRANGIPDAEILTYYTAPHPLADANMEARQVDETGRIYAPALQVKAAMRHLIQRQQVA